MYCTITRTIVLGELFAIKATRSGESVGLAPQAVLTDKRTIARTMAVRTVRKLNRFASGNAPRVPRRQFALCSLFLFSFMSLSPMFFTGDAQIEARGQPTSKLLKTRGNAGLEWDKLSVPGALRTKWPIGGTESVGRTPPPQGMVFADWKRGWPPQGRAANLTKGNRWHAPIHLAKSPVLFP